jgi:two-component system nitrate/nitrite response regulator NarL
MFPLRVLIADDHRLFRQGLIGLMNTRRDLVEVVGEAASGHEAIELTQQLRPDIVLMDIHMPDGDGLQATDLIRRLYPDTAVVILTASELDEHIYEAVKLGAVGYLLKSLDASELFDLLQGVAQGEAAMTRAMATRLLKSVVSHAAHAECYAELLTERELEVLKLVAQGASNPQIAEQLTITTNTVKVHLRNILDKLHVENRTQAAAYAVRSGLVAVGSPDDSAYHPIG